MGKWAKAAAQPLVPQKNASVFIAAGWCCSKGGTVSKLTFTSDGEKGLENPGWRGAIKIENYSLQTKKT